VAPTFGSKRATIDQTYYGGMSVRLSSLFSSSLGSCRIANDLPSKSLQTGYWETRTIYNTTPRAGQDEWRLYVSGSIADSVESDSPDFS
jgi:hypothetical protein